MENCVPNASVNSKHEHPPPGQPPGFCTYFQPGSRGFVPSELPGGCPGVEPIIKVPSCQFLPHEGTFQLQTDLPSYCCSLHVVTKSVSKLGENFKTFKYGT